MTGTAAARWEPQAGIFGPTTGLDPVLFDGDRLRPAVREAVMERLGGVLLKARMPAWRRWLKVYIAGGSASEWAGGRPNEGAQDLDVLIGVNYDSARSHSPSLRGMTDGQVDAALNAILRRDFNEQGWQPGFGGTWDLTGFANGNAYDIRSIRPYAAWNVSDDEWAVRPPHLPDHTLADFDPAVLDHARAVTAQARAILRMPEPLRTREARDLWEHVHAHRCVAFSPEGEGWQDPGNLDDKWLQYAPGHVLERIRALVFPGGRTASAVAVAGGRWYHGTNAELLPDDHVVLTRRGFEPDSGKYNYYTDEPGHARYHAECKSRTWGGNPHVYEVAPTGPSEPDPYDVTGMGNPYRSVHPLRVVREMTAPGTVTAGLEGQAWYHGSDHEFSPGDEVTTGHPMTADHRHLSRTVSFTADPEWAATYGTHVYRVEPAGPHHEDEVDLEADNRWSEHPLRILHEVVPDDPHAYPVRWVRKAALEEQDYWISHRPPGPGHTMQSGQPAASIPYHEAAGRHPDDLVDIYRAAPEDADAIHRGDWVSLHGDWTQERADSDSGYHVLHARVPARHVWLDASERDDDEAGYHGPSVAGLERTAGRREDQLSAMDRNQRASALAQEHVRGWHPKLTLPLYEKSGQRNHSMMTWLSEAGVPRADESYVAMHKFPDNRQSCTGRGPDGEPCVILHPDRYDYGTMAHETAHLIRDHQIGREINGSHPAGGAHDDHWAGIYAGLLGKISRDAGEDFLGKRREHLDADGATREPESPDLRAEGASHVGAAHFGPWYHGTHRDDFSAGDLIEPGHKPNWPSSRPDSVYLTSSEDQARKFAADAAYKAATYDLGHVYEVQPTGNIEEDRTVTMPGAPVRSFQSTSPLRVVRKVGTIHERPSKNKDDVDYRPADGGKRCGTCTMIRPGQEPGSHSCTLVRGPIDTGYVCDEWYPDSALEKEAATGYDGLTGRSAMIYLDLPEGAVRKVPGGVDDHHVTLVYLGKNVGDAAFEEAKRRASAAAAQTEPLSGFLRGVETFPPSDGSGQKVPAFVPAYVPGIGKLRSLLEDLSASEHRHYRPHVTLAYLEPGDDLPEPHPTVPVNFTHLHVKRGDDIVTFPLGGQGLSRVAAAGQASGGPWYHGSGRRYKPGDIIDPAVPHKRVHHQSDPSRVYFSDNAWNAQNWANVASPSGRGHVYEVEPTGHYEEDPHYSGPEERGIYDITQDPIRRINVYQTGEPLRVIRKL